MATIERRSPVAFPVRAVRSTKIGHWTVVQQYTNEGEGPWLIDLSHHPRWDLQDADIRRCKPFPVNVPVDPGTCTLDRGLLVNRMNRTQCSIWHLLGDTPQPPADPVCTETTDATALMALAGGKVFAITEKLTNLDLTDPGPKPPFLLQGPFCHVACQLVIAQRRDLDGTLLLACSRGYGQDMAHAILQAGEEFDLRPAGEDQWRNLLKQIQNERSERF
ncbi:hypothetical protein [Desulfoferrobacter suflitae]|uniref:hypothetical protein n=1 Tax=Desulfoferrobacter suflitae TaxID=2865782 RepID=UPI0021648516|nr:hypothetical protein [Desulfoferrobacter suflitae]MCK8603541.1 hypothetical protein [Desulfoferrobacter suflitae]